MTTIRSLFHAQAERAPTAIAVACEDLELTYGALQARARVIAGTLARAGVRPGDRVGLLVERSVEMVAAVIGILEAGAAYVPLDPGHPMERRAFVLDDASPAAVLTERRLVDRLPSSGRAPIVCLEDVAGPGASAPMDPAAIAYVLYTSGSTGKPKGVEVEDRGVVHTLRGLGRWLSIGEGQRWLGLASLSFDAAVSELFFPLMHGGIVHLTSRRQFEDASEIVALVRRIEPAIVQSTPSLWRLLIEAGFVAPRAQVAAIGEALPPDLARALLERARVVLNLYGPTETTIYATCWEVPRGTSVERILIGHAFEGVTLSIVDEQLQPVAQGEAGELLIGGPGVARGYLRRPELTAERFLAGAEGQRIYRSGDRCRFTSDHAVEYLGRLDGQVKIRGQRIELGEIEASLIEAGASSPVVVVWPDLAGGPRLVGYYLRVAGGPTEAELRAHLAGKLPAVMVPASLVALDRLPLSPNGKIDRRALPAPVRHAAGPAPATPTEEIVARLWAETLGVEAVGREDEFVALGGHSLAAMSIAVQVERALGVRMPMRAIFDHRDVARYASSIDAARAGGGSREAAALTPGEVAALEQATRSGEGTATVNQWSLWYLHQLHPTADPYVVAFTALLTARHDSAALARAVEAVARRHASLRTTFEARQGRIFQRVAETAPALEIVDAEGWDRPRLLSRMKEVLARPFDLARGPLFRAVLLQPGALVLAAHHIIVDGGSLDILVRDLGRAYAAERDGRSGAAAIGPPPSPAGFLAAGQLAGPAGQEMFAYWKNELAAPLPELDLRPDRPRPSAPSFRGAFRPVEVPAELAVALERAAKGRGTTLHVFLLASFVALLARRARQDEVIVGTPVSGRTRSELTETVGHFVNVVPIRARGLTEALSFDALLAQIHERCLGAISHQDLPFSILANVIPHARTGPDRNPVFQVAFALEQKEAPIELDAEPVYIDRGLSRFDLSFAIHRFGRGKWAAGVEYSTALFDDATIGALSGELIEMWTRLVAARDPRLGDLAPSAVLGAFRAHLPPDWKLEPAIVETIEALPRDLFDEYGCELKLSEKEGAPGLDFAVSVNRRYWPEIARLGRGERALGLDPGGAWGRIGALFDAVLAHEPQAVEGLLLEWDADEAGSCADRPLPPRIFLALHDHPKPWVLSSALPALAGAEALPDPLLRTVHRCIDGLPEGASILHFGTQLPLVGLRICITGLGGFDGVARYLSRIGAPEIADDMRAKLGGFDRLEALAELAFVNLDLMDGLIPRIGVECHPRSAASWPEVLEIARSAGVASSTLDAIRAWPGAHPSGDGEVVLRLASHLKLQFDAWRERPVLKTYLMCTTPRASRERGARPLRSMALPPKTGTLHGGFVVQARERPDAIALRCAGVDMSYRQLLERAEAVAAELLHSGLAQGELVAVQMGRGFDPIVAVLGVLLAGGAYLPMDRSWPRARVQEVLAQAGVTRALVDEDLRPEGVEIVRPQGRSHALPAVDPRALAYVIYTSGSTGRPKGVAIAHGSACNTIRDLQHRFAVGPRDRLIALSALTFDLSVYDVFGALAAGATLIVPSDGECFREGAPDPEALLRLVQDERVTVWSSVPAWMQLALVMARGQPIRANALRLVMLSGDWIPVTMPREIREVFGDQAQVISLGGATEASIWSILHPVQPDDERSPSIPYGRPDSMVLQRIDVLDADLRPQPPRTPGELYISGAGVAEGYWRDPELTRERFLPHPSGDGSTIYRTGDMGYLREDGVIMLLGRIDAQVKVQGFRVELAEIEARLLRQAGITEAAVIAHRDALHAFYVGSLAEDEDEALRARLASELPPYMVPRTYQRVDALPLSANGKVDRRALAERLSRSASARSDEGDAIERAVRELWCESLGVPDVGPHDDFHHLGGSSMIAAQLVVTIERRLQVRLHFVELYENLEFSRFVALVRRKVESPEEAPPETRIVVLVPRPEAKLRLYCFAAGGGDARSEYRDWSEALPEVEIAAVVSPGRDGNAPVGDLIALAELSARAIEAANDPRPFALAGMCMGGVVGFETARRLSRPPESLWVMSSGSPQDMDAFRVPDAMLAGVDTKDDTALLKMGLEAGLLKEYLSDELERMSLEARAEALSALLPTRLMLSDMLSEHHYRFAPGAPLTCPLTVISGDDLARGALTDAQLEGWSEVTRGTFRRVRLPGGHYIASLDGREHRWGRADVLAHVRSGLMR